MREKAPVFFHKVMDIQWPLAQPHEKSPWRLLDLPLGDAYNDMECIII